MAHGVLMVTWDLCLHQDGSSACCVLVCSLSRVAQPQYGQVGIDVSAVITGVAFAANLMLDEHTCDTGIEYFFSISPP